jgi:hypothetical protein
MSRCWIFYSLHTVSAYLLCKFIKPPCTSMEVTLLLTHQHLWYGCITYCPPSPAHNCLAVLPVFHFPAIHTSPFLSFPRWDHHLRLAHAWWNIGVNCFSWSYIHCSWWNKWSVCLCHTGIYPVHSSFNHLTYLKFPLSQKRWLLFSLCLGPSLLHTWPLIDWLQSDSGPHGPNAPRLYWRALCALYQFMGTLYLTKVPEGPKPYTLFNTFTAKVDHSRFNSSCLRLPASTLVDLIFRSRSFSLGGKLVQQLQYILADVIFIPFIVYYAYVAM